MKGLSVQVLITLSAFVSVAPIYGKVPQRFVTTCATDLEIPENDLAAIDNTAMRFVQTVLSNNPGAAFQVFTADAQRNVQVEDFAEMIRRVYHPMAPFSELHVAHTYIPKVIGGTRDQTVVCGNLASPEGWVAVTTKPGGEQAHVIVEAKSFNNDWAFIFWLLKEQTGWRVQYFQITAVAMVGKSAQDLWAMARAEQRLQHNFNATLLYAVALQFAGRGPNLQLGILPEIQKDIAQLRVPREIQGQPPFDWQFGKPSFKILSVGPIGIGGKIYLSIEQESSLWTNDFEADRKNRELIAAFKKAFPEYSGVFSGLLVATREKGGTRSFRTVDAEPEFVK